MGGEHHRAVIGAIFQIFDKDRALFGGPVVRWRLAGGAELFGGGPSCKRAHRDRRMRRAEDGGAGLRNALPRQFGHDRKAQHIAGLALIGRHAQRCIALQMLDRPEVFLIGQLDVLHGDIILLVDPGPALAMGHIPKRRHRNRRIFRLRQVTCDRRKAQIRQRLCGHGGPRGQRGLGGQMPGGSPGHGQSGRSVCARHEGRNGIVPDRAAPVVRGQAKVRIPAARNTKRIGHNRL